MHGPTDVKFLKCFSFHYVVGWVGVHAVQFQLTYCPSSMTDKGIWSIDGNVNYRGKQSCWNINPSQWYLVHHIPHRLPAGGFQGSRVRNFSILLHGGLFSCNTSAARWSTSGTGEI